MIHPLFHSDPGISLAVFDHQVVVAHSCLRLTQDLWVAAALADAHVKVWGNFSNCCLAELKGHSDQVHSQAVLYMHLVPHQLCLCISLALQAQALPAQHAG